MVILSFQEDTGKTLRIHKMKKSLYLPQMLSNPKNKGTLFSSTFKVENIKVHLFFRSDVILGRCELFYILLLVRGFFGNCMKSQNDKEPISLSNDG